MKDNPFLKFFNGNSAYFFLPCIKPAWKKELKKILSTYQYVFFVYGSRARGDNTEYSDLDLCILKNFSTLTEKSSLKSSLSNSNLPIKVSVVSWLQLSKDFQSEIKNDLIPLFY